MKRRDLHCDNCVNLSVLHECRQDSPFLGDDNKAVWPRLSREDKVGGCAKGRFQFGMQSRIFTYEEVLTLIDMQNEH